ncbi:hypothetical protein [Lyngbya sp. CCY1209]|uniref:hypothetical protein n=1 Tax=Lyngbya sp. CCY1209 TaxID=2886103 RepID=UPI002D2126DC|nr:hypothetical protein [Lyngbya sp. CCY1209]MEB3884402.1 hypothetical protein [Lyngbya sp. CCY1209]
MKTKRLQMFLIPGLTLAAVACVPTFEVAELRHYPVDNLEGIVGRSQLQFDPDISSDGNGSVKIIAPQPITVPLYETGDLDIENTRIFYQAKLKSRDLQGKAYLEMLCHFPGKGEFFSRALNSPLTGTQDWTSQDTPFILRPGENPDHIKLNLVIEGTGTVWIDDIRLVEGKSTSSILGQN